MSISRVDLGVWISGKKLNAIEPIMNNHTKSYPFGTCILALTFFQRSGFSDEGTLVSAHGS